MSDTPLLVQIINAIAKNWWRLMLLSLAIGIMVCATLFTIKVTNVSVSSKVIDVTPKASSNVQKR